MKQVAIYARVSTERQKTDPQLRDLRIFAKSRGWQVKDEYIDRGESGTKVSRPELNRLMDDVREGRVDGVLVWKFDRFARSLHHLVVTLQEFNERGIGFISYQENIDLSTSMGRAMYGIIGAMAQLERDMISERVKAGLASARAKGQRLGRPRVEIDVERVRKLAETKSVREVAREVGTSPATVWRMVSANKEDGWKKRTQ